MGIDLTALLDTIREKRDRLEALQREIATIQAELLQIEAAAKGRPARHAAMPKAKSRHGFVGGKRARPIRVGSSVDRARRLLQSLRRPMPVDELVEMLNAEGGDEVKKPTLVSNLSRYVQHSDTFNRPKPGYYGLLEFDEPEEEAYR